MKRDAKMAEGAAGWSRRTSSSGKYVPSSGLRRQEFRFLCRTHDPLKQWKLSPMDLESRRRWEDYTKAKEIMLERTHIPESPWNVVHAVDKKGPA